MENSGPPKVSVIIVSWNGRKWLEKSLPALAGQSFHDFEVIVVDNGSQDDSVAWMQEQWPQYQTLSLNKNEGFARANNIGMSMAQGEWIATLNNDTLVDKDWLLNFIRAADEPDVGMVASLVTYWNQPDIVDAAGIFIDRAGIAWNRGHGQAAANFKAPSYVFGPSASAGFYRRTMLEEIGLFDQNFFAYYEDVDLAWRAQNAGWRCRFCPGARVRHWHSATAGQVPQYKVYYQSRNKIWTIVKNYPWPDLLFRLPLLAVYDFLSLAYRLWSDRNLAGVKGRFSALRGMRSMWQSRTATGSAPLAPATAPWHFKRRQGIDGLLTDKRA